MSALSKVWVVSEAPERFAKLGAVGRRLGERVEAVAVGEGAAQAAASCGAEAVHTVAVLEGGLHRAVLFAAGKRTRLMAARVAAELGTRVLNDVGRIWVDDDGALLAEHMVYGGKAFAVERVREGSAVALLTEGLLVSEPAVEGAVFSQMANATDFSDPVTVLYGHNIVDDGMFATLHRFEDPSFFAENGEFYLYTPGHILVYQVVAAYEYDDRHILNSYNLSDPTVRQEYFNFVMHPDSLLVNTRSDTELSIDDKIVQLSTCMSDTNHTTSRYIVTGVLIDDQPTY